MILLYNLFQVNVTLVLVNLWLSTWHKFKPSVTFAEYQVHWTGTVRTLISANLTLVGSVPKQHHKQHQTLIVICNLPSHITASLAFCTVPSTTSAFRLSASLLINWLSIGSCKKESRHSSAILNENNMELQISTKKCVVIEMCSPRLIYLTLWHA